MYRGGEFCAKKERGGAFVVSMNLRREGLLLVLVAEVLHLVYPVRRQAHFLRRRASVCSSTELEKYEVCELLQLGYPPLRTQCILRVTHSG